MTAVHEEEDRATRFEQQRMERIKQLKKKKDLEERKNRQVRYDLKMEQIEKAKKAYANNPLTVNQLKIYENALKRVQKHQNSSPNSNKNKNKDNKKHSDKNSSLSKDDLSNESSEEQSLLQAFPDQDASSSW